MGGATRPWVERASLRRAKRLHGWRGIRTVMFRRATLLFVADAGQGFTGDKSLEEVVIAGRVGDRLWLHRRRDAKWRAEVHAWADAISGAVSRGA